MNPTIVSAFGIDKGLNRFMADKKHTFNVLGNEGATLDTRFENLPPTFFEALKMLDKDFKNLDIDDENKVIDDHGTGLEGFKKSSLLYFSE